MSEKANVAFQKALRDGNPRAAYKISKRLLQRNPEKPRFEAMAAAAAEKFDHDIALKHYRRAHKLAPTNLQIGRGLAMLLIRISKREEATQVVKNYLPADFDDFMPVRFEAELVPDIYKTANFPMPTHMNGEEPNRMISKWELKRYLYSPSIAESLALMGKMDTTMFHDELRELYDQVRDVLSVTESVIKALPEKLREDLEKEIEERIFTASRDCCMVFPAESDTTFIFFSGLAGNIGGVPLDKFHWHVRTLPANIVYVKDKDKHMHLWGIKGVADNLDAAILHLEKVAESLGTKKLVTVGFSGGTFASMWYGASLAAKNCKAYGPVTCLKEEFIRNEPRSRQSYLPHIERILRRVPRDFDLRSHIEKRPETLIELYYGKDCELDVYRADHLRGLENVRHKIIDGASEHQITLRLMAQNEFQATLLDNVET